MAVSHVLSSPIADFTGTVTVFDSAGSTQTANATEIVRPSDWNSAHNQFLTLAGNTAGQSTLSGTNIVWAGGPNVTLSANAGTVSVSVGAGGAGDGVNLIAAGTQTAASTGTVLFNNGNGITFGMANSSVVTASHNGLTSQSNQALSAANGSFTFQTATFANSNGVSFSTGTQGIFATVATNYAASDHSHGNPSLALTGINGTTASNSAGLTLSLSAIRPAFSADASSTFQTLTFQDSNGVSFSNNAGAIRLTHGLQFTSATSAITSNAAVSNHSHGASGQNGSFAFQTLSFSNANGVSFGTSAGSAITASHNALTTAAASDHSHGNPTLALTNLSGTTASNSAGFTLSLSAGVGGAGDGGNILAAGTRTAGSNSSVLFDNANGITFGLNAVGGSVMTASHNGLTTARASNDAIGLNTAQSNVTWTVNSSGLSLDARGYAGTGTTFAGANISASLTVNSAGWNGSFSVAAPGAAAENNNVNLLGANTAGNTTASGSTIGWSGVNVTLSGTNASQIVISAPASSSLVGVAPISISTNGSTISVYQKHLSVFEPYEFANNSAFSSHGQNSAYFQRLWPEFNYTFNNVEKIASLSFVSSTNSQSVAHTIRYGLYSRGTGASTSIMTQASTSAVIFIASFNSNTQAGYTVSQSGGGSYTSTSGGTGPLSQFTAGKIFYLPFAASMQAGVEYAFGFHVSTASAVGTSPARLSFLELTNLNNTTLGRISPSTVQLGSATIAEEWDGLIFSATSGALPVSYADSQCSVAVSRARQYLIFET